MKMRPHFFIILLFLPLLFIGATLPERNANDAPNAQVVTPTPGPDGRILYIVAEGDTCSSVALLHGIGVPQLRQLNTRLDENCTLTVGQQLVVGLVVSNAPTAALEP